MHGASYYYIRVVWPIKPDTKPIAHANLCPNAVSWSFRNPIDHEHEESSAIYSVWFIECDFRPYRVLSVCSAVPCPATKSDHNVLPGPLGKGLLDYLRKLKSTPTREMKVSMAVSSKFVRPTNTSNQIQSLLGLSLSHALIIPVYFPGKRCWCWDSTTPGRPQS